MTDYPRATDEAEILALWTARDSLGHPFLIQQEAYGPCYADADELRAWRASQNTSKGNET
jgi:hypothetical protein